MDEQNTAYQSLSALQFFDIIANGTPSEQKEIVEGRVDILRNYIKAGRGKLANETVKNIVAEVMARFMKSYYPSFLKNEVLLLRQIENVDGKLCVFAKNIIKENKRIVNVIEVDQGNNKIVSGQLLESTVINEQLTLPEIANELVKAIEQLSDIQQKVIIRRIFGKKSREIAKELEISPEQERKNVERAKRALAKVLPNKVTVNYDSLIPYLEPFLEQILKKNQ